MDRVCSGLVSCNYYVPSPDLVKIRCSTEVTSLFLRATYTCIESKCFTLKFSVTGLLFKHLHYRIKIRNSLLVAVVEKPTFDGQCSASKPEYTRHMTGFISNTIAEEENDHSPMKCPWLISSLPGQTINITIIDFQPQPSPESCKPLGYLKDLHNGHEVMICKSRKR